MSSRFNQLSNADQGVHFSRALFGKAERSRMIATPTRLTAFNAGDIVPIYCREILPDEELSIDLDMVLRQTTLLTPTMGNMTVDIFAFWVPNRIVNQSWKAVQGENFSGSWAASEVSLAPLKVTTTGSTTIPVGSVADYYDLPTQAPIPNSVLSKCNDLKFRGYVMIYNEHFRDQNYQPPVAMSTLNVYQGFLDSVGTTVSLDGSSGTGGMSLPAGTVGDGSFGAGAVSHALYNGAGVPYADAVISNARPENRFRATSKPFKANKLHDYFTSVLPSPQKSSSSVFAPVTGSISSVPVVTSSTVTVTGVHPSLAWLRNTGDTLTTVQTLRTLPGTPGTPGSTGTSATATGDTLYSVYPSNLQTQPGAEVTGLALSVDDIRMAAAVEQVFEVLSRGGSRYRSIVSSFFGIEVDDPFSDTPVCLGKITRDLDLYQTAQTSPSADGSTPQGNLAGFGYTSSSGHLFSHHFVEHGYVHILAVVRHRNVYASYMPRDWFRLNMLDFYTPQLANISEQPVYTREINPFAANPDNAFGYQEPWAEYRFEPDTVSGMMRPQASGTASYAIWNYADDFDSSLQISNGSWLRSNSEAVLNRTVAVTSSLAPQIKAAFKFKVDKTLPMPTYSVPGMDII